jgi:hypothetical protein
VEERTAENHYWDKIVRGAKNTEEKARNKWEALSKSMPARTHRVPFVQLSEPYKRRICQQATQFITKKWEIPIDYYRDSQNQQRHGLGLLAI